MAMLFQQPPGLLDRRADRRLGHLQQVGQDLLGAHLPQVDHGDQDAVAVGQDGPAVGAWGLAAPAATLLVAALLARGGLGRGQLPG
jgi:hypothetical protein